MKIKKTAFLGTIFSLLACVSIHAAEVAERGGGYHGGSSHYNNAGRYDHPGYDHGYYNGGYYGEGGYYGSPGVVVPGYGGYLLPGEVDPAQDEADAIYRANQHPPE